MEQRYRVYLVLHTNTFIFEYIPERSFIGYMNDGSVILAVIGLFLQDISNLI